MIAIECDTVVHNGSVTIPSEFEGRRVRLVVLTDNTPMDHRRAALQRAVSTPNRDSVPEFVPLSRDEANQR
jgi:hypothetical protein